jgi:hypothetical protein
MKVNKSVRIRTTPGGGEKSIGVKLTQEFDTIDFLSLKITQEEAYRNFCSDYGVVAGRVIANDGFGIQNAKVSVFIPISDEDAEDPIISSIYPFSTPLDKNTDDIRYNLLPKNGREFDVIIQIPTGSNQNNPTNPSEYLANPNVTALGSFKQGSQWELENELGEEIPGYSRWRRTVIGNGPKVPVGTFPSKSDILENDSILEVYDKYYKFTTTTNGSGDYMIFGVPIGQATVHMDVDLSDAGSATLTPSDLINLGFPSSAFQDNGDGNYSFKASTNLDELPQLETQNLSVDVVPFWGDLEQCEVGITRLDFNLSKTISPSALLIFEAFTNDSDFYIKFNGNDIKGSNGSTKENYSAIARMKNLEIAVEAVAVGDNGRNLNSTIFTDGKVIFPLPMYGDKYITTEEGDLVPSNDPNVGIPTEGQYNVFMFSPNNNIQLGVSTKKGHANHKLNGVKFRYDLINGKRLIYTPGFWIGSGENGIFGFSNSGDEIRHSLSVNGGANQTYPYTADYSSNKRFQSINRVGSTNKTPICYGSLYFPRMEYKADSSGETDWDGNFASGGNEVDAPNGCPLVHEGAIVGGSGPRIGIRNVLDITDILQIFKPYGGGLDTTSANLNVFNDYPAFPSSPNLSNQTIPLTSSNGVDNAGDVTWPNRLNMIPPPSEMLNYQNVNTYSNTITNADESGSKAKSGRYFFYFGLRKNDDVLNKLKNTF